MVFIHIASLPGHMDNKVLDFLSGVLQYGLYASSASTANGLNRDLDYDFSLIWNINE